MLGSSTVFLDFGMQFCVAGAMFGEVPVAPRIANDVLRASRTDHESHFAGQAQIAVRLEGDTCCSALLFFFSKCRLRSLSTKSQPVGTNSR